MLVDGKSLADQLLSELEGAPSKRVCFLSFSDDKATSSYVALKARVAEKLGLETEIVAGRAMSTEEALEQVREVVKAGFDGIVVQLPLPSGVDTQEVLDTLPRELDIDMLGSQAKEAYKSGETERVPPVVGAVERVLEAHKVDLADKKVVVLGKGKLVGEPVMRWLEKRGISYKSLDKLTPESELLSEIREADVLISGMGVPHFLKKEMLKPGVVLIDAGTSESEGRLSGDVDPECLERASLMTPVPGGLGPVTVAVLFSNLYKK